MVWPKGKKRYSCLLVIFFKWLKVLFSTLDCRLSENGKHDFKLSAEWMSLSRFEQLLTLNDLVLN